MHDSLGHELTLIAVRASVLQVSSGLDEQQRKAAGELRESAAAATERLREIIGVLRGSPETIAGLIARGKASGMIIKARVDSAGVMYWPGLPSGNAVYHSETISSRRRSGCRGSARAASVS